MFKVNVQYKVTNYSLKKHTMYTFLTLVVCDKLVKAQMSRKTPPLFFHQLTPLSCFALVIVGNTAHQ